MRFRSSIITFAYRGDGAITGGIQHQDITFISDVYSSIARGDGIEPAIASYTRNFPDVRFSWQAMCHKTSTYFAYTPYNFDADVERDYLEVSHLNGMPAMASRFPVSQVIKSEYFLTTRDYERTDIYNLFFRPRDELNASAGLWAYREGDNAALLTVDIPKRIGSSERLALHHSLAAILPHLQNSFALMMELDIKRKRTAPMDFWLETLPSAAFCVSANGRVNGMNAPARKLAKSAAGLAVLRSRRLSFGSDEQRRAIEPRLRKALVTLQPEGPFPIPAPTPHRLAGFCVPLSHRDQRDAILDFFRNGQRDVLLVVTDSGDLPPTSATFLSRTLGLTPAEAQVVARLCTGGDLRSAASEIGISYNTARTQLASAVDRMGLKRQTEAVAVAVKTTGELRAFLPPEDS